MSNKFFLIFITFCIIGCFFLTSCEKSETVTFNQNIATQVQENLKDKLLNSTEFFTLTELSMEFTAPIFDASVFENGFDFKKIDDDRDKYFASIDESLSVDQINETMKRFFNDKDLNYFLPLMREMEVNYKLLNSKFPELSELNPDELAALISSIYEDSKQLRELTINYLQDYRSFKTNGNLYVCLAKLWGCLVFYAGGEAAAAAWGCSSLGPAAPYCWAASSGIVLYQAFDCYHIFWDCY